MVVSKTDTVLFWKHDNRIKKKIDKMSSDNYRHRFYNFRRIVIWLLDQNDRRGSMACNFYDVNFNIKMHWCLLKGYSYQKYQNMWAQIVIVNAYSLYQTEDFYQSNQQRKWTVLGHQVEPAYPRSQSATALICSPNFHIIA